MSSQLTHHYSDKRLWLKLGRYAKVAGRQVVEKTLWLYYALKNPGTPMWAKAIILGTLGYFIFPVDAIPDFIPIVGYVDDLGALAAAVAAVALYIDEDVKAKAKDKLKDWFGEPAPRGTDLTLTARERKSSKK